MNPITVSTIVRALMGKVWEYWTKPECVKGWNFASDDWECPKGENELRVGGKFSYIMAAKDKSASFDFGGTYTAVEEGKLIEYVMEDGRKVKVEFEKVDEDAIKVTETFDPEEINSEEMQRGGWQAILDNFKKYAEAH